ncbi:HAD-superfamily hydrolase [Neoconidiobolus thromboides FSU 785]|nr:HAD-superfamily hydrolase [Neoconidiobolus thromboides FSU 785]
MKFALNLLKTQLTTRHYSTNTLTIHQLKEAYQKIKSQHFQPKTNLPHKNFLITPTELNPNGVFCHNEVNLDFIQTYGFDYDYTLANYTQELPKKIFTMLRDMLVLRMGYPKALLEFNYDPSFAVRGLHYDVKTGYLMKVDAYHNIQLNTVYFGKQPIKDINTIIELHNGTHISPKYMLENLTQLNDMFSLPEICLLADIIDYFNEKQIQFHPRHLYDDVRAMGEAIHSSAYNHPFGVGLLHLEILKQVPKYLEPSNKLVNYLQNLRKGKKELFLLTNSGYLFVNKGMEYLTSSKDWRDLFDVVVVSSKKPSFYTSHRPFRRVKTNGDRANQTLENSIELDMEAVSKFQRGQVYQGGNLKEFSKLTGWRGQKVMYIGDHIYSDLVDPTLQQGWRTGAIIDELETEMEYAATPQARSRLSYLLHLEQLLLLASNNGDQSKELGDLVQQWRLERKQYRNTLKQVYNLQFGSLFRTHHNPTYFAKKVRTFADLYTSKLENLNDYPLNYTFYPQRDQLPHELPNFINQELYF